MSLRSRLKRGMRALKESSDGRSFWELPPETAVRVAYNVILNRDPDPIGQKDYLSRLKDGRITIQNLADSLRGSEEAASLGPSLLAASLHLSRCHFVRSLPKASHIMDLGGLHQLRPDGALVAMGYPYHFESLTIVDLPLEASHSLYKEWMRPDGAILSEKGPVYHSYRSMVDLDSFEDRSSDLVYCGQAIEHVTKEEAIHVCREVRRILRSEGWFALDTPNRRITRLQQEGFSSPDHKNEYTHQEMTDVLRASGLRPLEAKGLNYMGMAAARGEFSDEEVSRNAGIFTEIEDCYLLAYVCVAG